MFIRKVPHKNLKTRKEYYTYKLVDSVRTQRGPRQRTVLNLGVDFSLPKEQWKDLANCVEEIITGQQSLIAYPQTVRTLARKYAKRIISQEADVIDEIQDIAPDYATVDLNSVNNEEARTVGAEYVVYETIKALGIEQKLKGLGFNRHQLAAAIGVIAGRMIVPGSERATHYWLQNTTALGELIGYDFSFLSLDRLYKASDHLMKHKQSIEDHLCKAEARLFVLEEKIILYDLTNTFLDYLYQNPKYGQAQKDCDIHDSGGLTGP